MIAGFEIPVAAHASHGDPWVFVATALFFGVLGLAVGYLVALRSHARRTVPDTGVDRDPLTGLFNRTVAEQTLREAAEARQGLTIALADLDDLKVLNDSHGHQAGDAYLVAVAARLVEATAGQAVVARYGGDEFLVLSRSADVRALRSAIAATLVEPIILGGLEIRARVSVGVARFRAGSTCDAVARADAAMYSAKSAGGDLVLVYNAERDGVPRNGLIERRCPREDARAGAARSGSARQRWPIMNFAREG